MLLWKYVSVNNIVFSYEILLQGVELVRKVDSNQMWYRCASSRNFN